MNNGFPNLLRKSIWHTTHPDRFEKTLRTGEILANLDIPDAECWTTSRGPDYYSYVRHIGGVNRFNFCGFVPIYRGWPNSIWLEIDTREVNGEYVEAKKLWERQDTEGAHRHTLVPRIEAAVIGSIPLGVIEAAHVIREGSEAFELLEFQR